MQLTVVVENFNSRLWGHYLPIPEEVARQFIEGENRRVVCHIGDLSIHSALMPGKGGWFILINKDIRAKLGVEEGDKLSISLEKETAEYGMPMPEEMMVLLDQDEAGSRYFHALTPGKQRSLIYIVSKVKNIDSRINKALAILDHLKEMQGRLDFKRLNLKIKEYNRRGKLF